MASGSDFRWEPFMVLMKHILHHGLQRHNADSELSAPSTGNGLSAELSLDSMRPADACESKIFDSGVVAALAALAVHDRTAPAQVSLRLARR